MLNRSIEKYQLWYFAGFAIISIIAMMAAVVLREFLLLVVPFLILFAYITFIDFKKIFFLLIFLLPLSVEIQIGSLGTDLPTEPLIVALMFAFFLLIAARPNLIPYPFLKHPIIVTLLVHLAWMAFIIMHAENTIVSLKFVLAKTWYIVTFVFVGGLILNNVDHLKKFFWLIFIPLSLLVIQTLVRFATYGFDFEFVNEPMFPFFRNHVNYAAMITIFYPFIFLAATWYKKGSFKRRIIQFAKVLYLVGIYFSYTRACFLALFLAGVAYVVINYRLLAWGFRIGVAVLIGAVAYLSINNNYLQLAPDYSKTIHHKNFADHLTATIELQDVSSMERVYRWVSAFHMIQDRPITGFGTGNFYPYYQRYTVSDFQTYTSDNEERSTVHNYFLLTLVEQGIVGLLLFLGLTLAIFHYGEKGYLAEKDKQKRQIILTVMLSMVIIYTNLMLSDLVEVDKTGGLFFMNVALLVNLLVGNFSVKEKKVELETKNL
ncbi:MAG: O-antigen ligase family protein [Chitinophagales bacterium]|nr:O-antigen ligase family protein [Chitinophagales bacterium]